MWVVSSGNGEYAHHGSTLLSYTENRCEKIKARLFNFLGLSFRI